MTAFEFNLQLVGFEKKLFHFARRLTRNNEDAKDLVQETMVKAIICKDQFAEYTSLHAWTYTIMRNTFINNYRKKTRNKEYFDHNNAELVHYKQIDTKIATPDSSYSEHEILKLIENLSEVCRVPFQMHIEGYKYEEIALKLNVNLGTVKSRIFLTRKKLKFLLEDNN